STLLLLTLLFSSSPAFFFSFTCSCDLPDLHSFPTRRSSDLFQQIGGLQANPVAVELTYGIERLAAYIQDKENVFDLEWVDGVTYGDIFKQPEYEHSKYAFETSDTSALFELFSLYESEAKQ